MLHYDYHTKGTCSRLISLDIDNGIVRNVSFLVGCNGNLKAISALVEGKSVEEIQNTLSGILCGVKSTSCADQLAQACKEAYEKEKKMA